MSSKTTNPEKQKDKPRITGGGGSLYLKYKRFSALLPLRWSDKHIEGKPSEIGEWDATDLLIAKSVAKQLGGQVEEHQTKDKRLLIVSLGKLFVEIVTE